MNILHLKYAVEVERTRSISKAAENLYMGQPNLSRAIKELEESLGITIFERGPRGISLTAQGDEFMRYARKIIAQVDEVEALYKRGNDDRLRFSVSVPRASYIACAFTEFASKLPTDRPCDIFYDETNSMQAINNITGSDYRLGVIRCQTVFTQYFESLLREKGLKSELLTEFSYVAVMNADSPLARKAYIVPEELSDYIEIAHADPYVPSMPLVDSKRAELSEHVNKRIYVFERGSQMDLLSRVPSSFMWVSPIPTRLLGRYGLTERPCPSNTRRYRDMLIYRESYKLTELDRDFVETVRKYIP